MSTEAKICQFILENYLFTSDPASLANHDSFLKKGIIDSTGILEVISFLGEAFVCAPGKVADKIIIKFPAVLRSKMLKSSAAAQAFLLCSA